MDRLSIQKTNKETLALNDTVEQMTLRDAHRTFHPKTSEYTSFRYTWNILQDRLHVRTQNESQ